MKKQRLAKSTSLAAVFLLVAVLINPIKMAGFSCKDRPAIGKVSFMKYTSEKEHPPAKTCLCGRDFRVPWSFVVIEAPVLTIVGVCSDCSRKLRYGSFAERLSIASLLLRKACAEGSAL